MFRAAIYLRISQDRDGTMLGADRQREDCLALCKKRKWEVVEVFVDDVARRRSRMTVAHPPEPCRHGFGFSAARPLSHFH
jgi:DNA invertase Pin-like site-specific DNA recombinase